MVVMSAAQQLGVARKQSDTCSKNTHRNTVSCFTNNYHQANYPSCVLITQTWGGKPVDLFVGDGHHGVVELLHEIRDGLVGQEDGHGRQQQVDEDEDDGEDVLQAGFVESHRWTAFSDVVLCDGTRGGGTTSIT